jgi:hypothetical protein
MKRGIESGGQDRELTQALREAVDEIRKGESVESEQSEEEVRSPSHETSKSSSENDQLFLQKLKRYAVERLTPEKLERLRRVTAEDINNIGIKGRYSDHVLDALSALGYQVLSIDHTKKILELKNSRGGKGTVRFGDLKTAMIALRHKASKVESTSEAKVTPPNNPSGEGNNEHTQNTVDSIEDDAHKNHQFFLKLRTFDLNTLTPQERGVLSNVTAEDIKNIGVQGTYKDHVLDALAVLGYTVLSIDHTKKRLQLSDSQGGEGNLRFVDIRSALTALRHSASKMKTSDKENVNPETGVVAKGDHESKQNEAMQAVPLSKEGKALLKHFKYDLYRLSHEQLEVLRAVTTDDINRIGVPGSDSVQILNALAVFGYTVSAVNYNAQTAKIRKGDESVQSVQMSDIKLALMEICAVVQKEALREKSQSDEVNPFVIEDTEVFDVTGGLEENVHVDFDPSKEDDDNKIPSPGEVFDVTGGYMVGDHTNESVTSEEVTEELDKYLHGEITGIGEDTQDLANPDNNVRKSQSDDEESEDFSDTLTEDVLSNGQALPGEVGENTDSGLFSPGDPEEKIKRIGEDTLEHELAEPADPPTEGTWDRTAHEFVNNEVRGEKIDDVFLVQGSLVEQKYGVAPVYPEISIGQKLEINDADIKTAVEEAHIPKDTSGDPEIALELAIRRRNALEFLATAGYTFDKGKLRPLAENERSTLRENRVLNEKADVEEVAIRNDLVFDTRFETTFGLTREEMFRIDGFEDLSREQQMLIYENLNELVQAQSQKSLAGKLFSGFATHFLNAEKVEEQQFGKGKGMSKYGDFIRRAVETMNEYGPKRVHVENGVLEPDLVSIDFDRANRGEQWKAVRALNIAAYKLAQMPVSWQEDGIGTHAEDEPGERSRFSKFATSVSTFFRDRFSERRKRYLAYQEVQQAYESARDALSAILLESGILPGAVAMKLNEVDHKVLQLQIIETQPEVTEAMETIEDPGFIKKIGSAVWEAKTPLALGYLTRTFFTSTLGALSGPFVAAARGGARSWNQTSAELRERDRNARAGVENPKIAKTLEDIAVLEGIDPVARSGIQNMRLQNLKNFVNAELNVVSVVNSKEVNGEQIDRGLAAKLEALVGTFSTGIVDGSLENINEKGVREKHALLDRLQARVQYTEDKLKLNRIRFGQGAEVPANMARLFQALGAGRMILETFKKDPKTEKTENIKAYHEGETDAEGFVTKTAIQARLDSFMQTREGTIHNSRRALQQRALTLAMVRDGAIGLAGFELAEYVRDHDMLSTAWEKSAAMYKSITETSNFDMSQFVPDPEPGFGPEISEVRAESAFLRPATEGAPEQIILPGEELRSIPENPVRGARGSYKIERNDTLTEILRNNVPEIKNSIEGSQDTKIANLLNEFSGKLTDEDLKRIGLRDRNFDLIYEGDSINIDELNKIITEKHFLNDSVGGAPDTTFESLTSAPSSTESPQATSSRVETPSSPVDVVSPQTNVVEMRAVQGEKIRTELIDTMRIKSSWSRIGGYYVKDLPQLVQEDSLVSQEVRNNLNKVLHAQEVLAKAGVKPPSLRNETVNEYMTRATRLVAENFTAEEQKKLLGKMATVKGLASSAPPSPKTWAT